MIETCETAGRRTSEWTVAAWPRGSQERVDALPRGDRAAASPRVWAAGTVVFVVFWSLTYLLRQPGVAAVASRPFSLLGDFALEGACLALAWLALVVVACLAVLRGAIVFSPDR
jgi:hypothetical protein